VPGKIEYLIAKIAKIARIAKIEASNSGVLPTFLTNFGNLGNLGNFGNADVMEQLASAIQSTADFLFVPILVIVLFGTGLFLTVRLGFVQVRRFGDALRAFFGQRQAGTAGVLTPFQAFMTALAATIGTGNIAGVAVAIVSGGPGALFWIWAYGLLATAIKFSEAVLGITFRQADGQSVRSGPMYYLRDGLRSPGLAMTYAVVAGIAALTTTPFTQTNSIALVMNTQVGVPMWMSGVTVAVLTWLVIIGGIQSIGRAAQALTPLKVGLYLLGGLAVIVTFASRIPDVLALVFREAFSFRATAGGSIGILVAMRYGLARGLYANEAGYGTAAVAYGTARSQEPVQQGLNAVMEVFIVSFVTSTISALSILLTGAYVSGQTSTAAVALAFNAAIPSIGGYIVSFCVFLFGYTTLIGWSYYGEKFLEYWLGPRVVMPYRWMYCLLIPFGATTRVDLVWAWGDLMNALQIFPNLIGVVGLSGLVATVATQRMAAAQRVARS
jgi:AGCS family alanine or glycine:cation symporter